MNDQFPVYEIKTLNQARCAEIRDRINAKTKPLGALGQMESLAERIALIQSRRKPVPERIEINQPVMLVFAADHGIAAHPVSIAPQAVTFQMVMNFLAGGAAINCFCRANDVDMRIIDAGVITAVETDDSRFISARIAAGTADITEQSAMTRFQLIQAINSGAQIANQQIDSGSNVLAFGEMGIGNTSCASALLALVEGVPVSQAVGKGTGITEAQLQEKIRLIQQAVNRVRSAHPQLPPEVVLMEAGGFEIAQMVGAMLAGAERGITLLIDGFIVSVAALIAVRIEPSCRDYMVFAHCSAEKAHIATLDALGARPLLDLELRLGEGTGAALAVPLLRAACAFYNDMATFESAGVTV